MSNLLYNMSCMGGFCAHRDRCALYHAEDRSNPAERLCAPGMDGEDPAFIPIVQAIEPRPQIKETPCG